MTASDEPTLADRIAVHRAVEWLRSHEAWPEPGAEDYVCVARLAGVPLPQTREGLRLFEEEIAREVSVIEPLAAGGGGASLDECSRPVDSYGELTGGRPGVSRLLCRRTDEGVFGEDFAGT